MLEIAIWVVRDDVTRSLSLQINGRQTNDLDSASAMQLVRNAMAEMKEAESTRQTAKLELHSGRDREV
jgi:hypothetical protein